MTGGRLDGGVGGWLTYYLGRWTDKWTNRQTFKCMNCRSNSDIWQNIEKTVTRITCRKVDKQRNQKHELRGRWAHIQSTAPRVLAGKVSFPL